MDEGVHDSAWLEACLNRLRFGDSAARLTLVNFASDRFRRLAHVMMRDYARFQRWFDSADVWNGALLRISERLKTVHPATVSDFERLMTSCIRRELIDLARHYSRQAGPARHEQAFGVGPNGDGAAGGDVAGPSSLGFAALDEWTEFHEHAGRLPPEQLDVFNLVYYHGMTQQQAADRLQMPLGTVRLRWYQAKKTLMDRMARSQGDPVRQHSKAGHDR